MGYGGLGQKRLFMGIHIIRKSIVTTLTIQCIS